MDDFEHEMPNVGPAAAGGWAIPLPSQRQRRPRPSAAQAAQQSMLDAILGGLGDGVMSGSQDDEDQDGGEDPGCEDEEERGEEEEAGDDEGDQAGDDDGNGEPTRRGRKRSSGLHRSSDADSSGSDGEEEHGSGADVHSDDLVEADFDLDRWGLRGALHGGLHGGGLLARACSHMHALSCHYTHA